MALVLDQNYWNQGYGTECCRAIVDYARFLKEKGYSVPSDVTDKQQEEIKELMMEEKSLNAHGEPTIKWVYLPFIELRATCSGKNEAAYKMFNNLNNEFKILT